MPESAHNDEHYLELYKKYRPDTWDGLIGQQSVVASLRRTVAKRQEAGAYGFFGPRGSGKDLHKDTLIPTPYGMTTMGEVQIGDTILGSDGGPTIVTNKYRPMDPELYEMTFNGGEIVKCGSGHLWNVLVRANENDGEGATEHIETLETRILFEDQYIEDQPRYSIPLVTGSAQFVGTDNEDDLIVEFMDSDISNVEYVIPEGIVYATPQTRKTALIFIISVLGKQFDDMLIITHPSIQVLDQIATIMHSMGEVTHVDYHKKRIVMFPRRTSLGETIFGSDVVNEITPHDTGRHIVDIRRIEDNPEDYYCISVDSTDNLFLCTDHYIPTHNTSSAFVMAKAVNCDNIAEDGNPCNQCDSCASIDDGSNPGVQYLSMANHGSVAEIRDLMDRASYKTSNRKQVLIMDEIHNLSKAAFDALLIPLEDTKRSRSSLFILCSTEVDKVPDTVRSRIQQRKFTLVAADPMRDHLEWILKEEGLTASSEIVEEAVRRGHGSVREAISSLEGLLTTEDVSPSLRGELLEALSTGDLSTVYSSIAQMTADGIEGRDIAEDLFSDLRDFLLLSAKVDPTLYVAPAVKDVKAVFRGLGGKSGITAAIGQVGDGITQMAFGADSRTILEVSLFKAVQKISAIKKRAAAAKSQSDGEGSPWTQ